MYVVDSFSCDNKSSLLGPLEHVSFFNFVGEEQLFSLNQRHQFWILLETDEICGLDFAHRVFRLNHLINYKIYSTLSFKLWSLMLTYTK
jgi:hypothetical protein